MIGLTKTATTQQTESNRKIRSIMPGNSSIGFFVMAETHNAHSEHKCQMIISNVPLHRHIRVFHRLSSHRLFFFYFIFCCLRIVILQHQHHISFYKHGHFTQTHLYIYICTHASFQRRWPPSHYACAHFSLPFVLRFFLFISLLLAIFDVGCCCPVYINWLAQIE